MSDPLSISASIAGLIGLATQVLSLIGNIKSKSSNELDALSREVSGMHATLLQLQKFVQSHSTKVQSDEEWLQALSNALNECGNTFLGLEKLLAGLVTEHSYQAIWKKLKWTLKDKDIQDAQRRLESYKATIDLLLSIHTS
jgi:chromosome segregation ATPase